MPIQSHADRGSRFKRQNIALGTYTFEQLFLLFYYGLKTKLKGFLMLLLLLSEQIPMKKFAMYGYMYGQKLFNSPKVPYSVQVPTTCDMQSAWIPEKKM